MINSYSCKGNILIIREKSRQFAHLIRDVKLCEDKIIVLLETPFNDDEINNLYAVNEKCEIVWQAEKLEKLYTNQVLLPYE